jgi:Protein of unknown function (DUF3040)
MPLSPRDAKNLAAIENNLAADDPRLARLLETSPTAPDWRLPIRPVHAAILASALAALAGLHAVAGGLHPLITAILTCLLGVGWIVYTARSSIGPHPARRSIGSRGPSFSSRVAKCRAWFTESI